MFIVTYFSVVPYEVTVTTADEDGAGTDCKISMTVFGVKGASAVLHLRKKEDTYFERARTDIIKVSDTFFCRNPYASLSIFDVK